MSALLCCGVRKLKGEKPKRGKQAHSTTIDVENPLSHSTPDEGNRKNPNSLNPQPILRKTSTDTTVPEANVSLQQPESAGVDDFADQVLSSLSNPDNGPERRVADKRQTSSTDTTPADDRQTPPTTPADGRQTPPTPANERATPPTDYGVKLEQTMGKAERPTTLLLQKVEANLSQIDNLLSTIEEQTPDTLKISELNNDDTEGGSGMMKSISIRSFHSETMILPKSRTTSFVDTPGIENSENVLELDEPAIHAFDSSYHDGVYQTQANIKAGRGDSEVQYRPPQKSMEPTQGQGLYIHEEGNLRSFRKVLDAKNMKSTTSEKRNLTNEEINLEEGEYMEEGEYTVDGVLPLEDQRGLEDSQTNNRKQHVSTLQPIHSSPEHNTAQKTSLTPSETYPSNQVTVSSCAINSQSQITRSNEPSNYSVRGADSQENSEFLPTVTDLISNFEQATSSDEAPASPLHIRTNSMNVIKAKSGEIEGEGLLRRHVSVVRVQRPTSFTNSLHLNLTNQRSTIRHTVPLQARSLSSASTPVESASIEIPVGTPNPRLSRSIEHINNSVVSTLEVSKSVTRLLTYNSRSSFREDAVIHLHQSPCTQIESLSSLEAKSGELRNDGLNGTATNYTERPTTVSGEDPTELNVLVRDTVNSSDATDSSGKKAKEALKTKTDGLSANGLKLEGTITDTNDKATGTNNKNLAINLCTKIKGRGHVDTERNSDEDGRPSMEHVFEEAVIHAEQTELTQEQDTVLSAVSDRGESHHNYSDIETTNTSNKQPNTADTYKRLPDDSNNVFNNTCSPSTPKKSPDTEVPNGAHKCSQELLNLSKTRHDNESDWIERKLVEQTLADLTTVGVGNYTERPSTMPVEDPLELHLNSDVRDRFDSTDTDNSDKKAKEVLETRIDQLTANELNLEGGITDTSDKTSDTNENDVNVPKEIQGQGRVNTERNDDEKDRPTTEHVLEEAVNNAAQRELTQEQDTDSPTVSDYGENDHNDFDIEPLEKSNKQPTTADTCKWHTDDSKSVTNDTCSLSTSNKSPHTKAPNGADECSQEQLNSLKVKHDNESHWNEHQQVADQSLADTTTLRVENCRSTERPSTMPVKDPTKLHLNVKVHEGVDSGNTENSEKKAKEVLETKINEFSANGLNPDGGITDTNDNTSNKNENNVNVAKEIQGQGHIDIKLYGDEEARTSTEDALEEAVMNAEHTESTQEQDAGSSTVSDHGETDHNDSNIEPTETSNKQPNTADTCKRHLDDSKNVIDDTCSLPISNKSPHTEAPNRADKCSQEQLNLLKVKHDNESHWIEHQQVADQSLADPTTLRVENYRSTERPSTMPVKDSTKLHLNVKVHERVVDSSDTENSEKKAKEVLETKIDEFSANRLNLDGVIADTNDNTSDTNENNVNVAKEIQGQGHIDIKRYGDEEARTSTEDALEEAVMNAEHTESTQEQDAGSSTVSDHGETDHNDSNIEPTETSNKQPNTADTCKRHLDDSKNVIDDTCSLPISNKSPHTEAPNRADKCSQEQRNLLKVKHDNESHWIEHQQVADQSLADPTTLRVENYRSTERPSTMPVKDPTKLHLNVKVHERVVDSSDTENSEKKAKEVLETKIDEFSANRLNLDGVIADTNDNTSDTNENNVNVAKEIQGQGHIDIKRYGDEEARTSTEDALEEAVMNAEHTKSTQEQDAGSSTVSDHGETDHNDSDIEQTETSNKQPNTADTCKRHPDDSKHVIDDTCSLSTSNKSPHTEAPNGADKFSQEQRYLSKVKHDNESHWIEHQQVADQSLADPATLRVESYSSTERPSTMPVKDPTKLHLTVKVHERFDSSDTENSEKKAKEVLETEIDEFSANRLNLDGGIADTNDNTSDTIEKNVNVAKEIQGQGHINTERYGDEEARTSTEDALEEAVMNAEHAESTQEQDTGSSTVSDHGETDHNDSHIEPTETSNKQPNTADTCKRHPDDSKHVIDDTCSLPTSNKSPHTEAPNGADKFSQEQRYLSKVKHDNESHWIEHQQVADQSLADPTTLRVESYSSTERPSTMPVKDPTKLHLTVKVHERVDSGDTENSEKKAKEVLETEIDEFSANRLNLDGGIADTNDNTSDTIEKIVNVAKEIQCQGHINTERYGDEEARTSTEDALEEAVMNAAHAESTQEQDAGSSTVSDHGETDHNDSDIEPTETSNKQTNTADTYKQLPDDSNNLINITCIPSILNKSPHTEAPNRADKFSQEQLSLLKAKHDDVSRWIEHQQVVEQSPAHPATVRLKNYEHDILIGERLSNPTRPQSFNITTGTGLYHESHHTAVMLSPRDVMDIDSVSVTSSSMELARIQRTKTEELTQSEVEETVTMVITGVVLYPKLDAEKIITLQEAIDCGVLDMKHGIYRNMTSHESMPMIEAMNTGFIKMGPKKVNKSKENKRSVGLITIKTSRETIPYTIQGVKDTVSGNMLDVRQAERLNIIDLENGTYTNRATGEQTLIGDAADNELVHIQFKMDSDDTVWEQISKTYYVYTVLDTLRRKKLTFHEAVERGIIDEVAGEYLNTATRSKVSLEEAINRGFVKAQLMESEDKRET